VADVTGLEEEDVDWTGGVSCVGAATNFAACFAAGGGRRRRHSFRPTVMERREEILCWTETPHCVDSYGAFATGCHYNTLKLPKQRYEIKKLKFSGD